MTRTLQLKVLDPRFGGEWPLPAYATAASVTRLSMPKAGAAFTRIILQRKRAQ